MKKLFLLLLLIPFSVSAYTSSATSVVLMDMDSNQVIYGSNIDKIRAVASISKIMTAIIAIECNKLDDVVKIDEDVLKTYGSAVYLQVGEEIRLEDLVYALMLQSGNDASIAISKHVGGSVDNFVSLMNEQAIKIGMKNSTFNNPNGLDDKNGNLSTSYDMAILTSYAMKNETYRKIVSTKKYKLKTNMNSYVWKNKHKLLGEKYITGGKTGFTDTAKRTLVTTASKDNVNLVVVTLNDGNDFSDHTNLINEGLNNLTNYEILKKGKIEIIEEKYYQDSKFYINNNYAYTLQNNNNKVLLNFKLNKLNEYKDGDGVGIVEVIINNKKVHEEEIFVKKEKATIFTKIKNWFKND